MKTTPTFAAELVAYDPSGPSTRTLTYASKGFTSRPSETPANATFAPVITQPIDIKRTMFAGRATRGRATTALGQLVLDNSDGALDDLAGYAFDGRAVTVRSSTVYQPAYPADFTPVIIGTIKGQPELSVTDIRFTVRDRLADIAAVPLQTTRYAGSNALPDGLEGVPEDLGGKPKPVCFGVVKNVPAPCVNTSKLIYQVNDGAVDSIDAVYDRGVPITNGVRNWTSQATGFGGSSINAATYGNGLFVIAGASGKLSTSPDGVTWTSRTSGFGTTAIRGLTYGNGLFIAVGDSGTLTTSPDAVTWTAQTSGFGATTIRAVGYGNGLYVAVGDSAKLFTSPDGITWTSRTSGFTASNIKGVAYGANIWVVVGDSSKIATSPTGTTWTLQTSASTTSADPYQSVAYGIAAGFVAVGDNGQIAVAADGKNWLPFANSNFGSVLDLATVTYGNGLYVASTTAGAGVTPVGFSEDGRVWSLIYQFSAAGMTSSAYGGGLFLVATTGGVAYTSYGQTVYASLADLQDDSLAPPLGTFGVYLGAAGGGAFFRLAGTPDGIITADVTEGATAADRTVGQIAKTLLLRAGVSSGDIDSGDISALDAAENAEIGFWSMADGMTCLTALDQVVGTCGAACFVGADGTFHLQQLLAPSGTPDLSLTANDIIGLTRVAPSDADKGIPTWRTRVRWGRNYQTITNDIAGAVTDSERARLAQEWRDVTAEDTAVQTAYPSSQEYVVESLYSTEADAQAEADRLLLLRKVQRAMYDVPVELNDDTTAVDIGMVVQITYPRFGLDGGALFRVLDVAPDARNHRVTLTVWG